MSDYLHYDNTLGEWKLETNLTLAPYFPIPREREREREKRDIEKGEPGGIMELGLQMTAR